MLLTEASAVVLSFSCWTPQSEPLTPTMDQSERTGPSREFETLELGLCLPWLGGGGWGRQGHIPA